MQTVKESKRGSKKGSKKAHVERAKSHVERPKLYVERAKLHVERAEKPPEVVANQEHENGHALGKVKFKGVMQHDEAVHYLGAILNGLRKGKLQFKQGEESVALEPSGASVRVEVKAERKSDKEKLSLELSWHTGEEDDEKLEGD